MNKATVLAAIAAAIAPLFDERDELKAGAALTAAVTKLTKDLEAAAIVPPTLSISDKTQAEGNAGESLMLFTVTRSGDVSGISTAMYVTKDGTGNKTDYKPASGTVNFSPGVTSIAIPVTILGDTYAETDNAFTVELSHPIGCTIADGVGLGTIKNDDATTPVEKPPITRPPLPPTPKPDPGVVKVIRQVPESGNAIEIRANGTTVGPTKLLDGKGSALFIAASNVTVRGIEIGKVGQYPIVVETGTGIVINATVIGGSEDQSLCRTLTVGASITLDHCTFLDLFARDKAILRGPGRWLIKGGVFYGAVIGCANPLGRGDGGREVLVTTIKLAKAIDGTWIYHAKNDDEVRAYVMAKAKTTSDPMELARAFREKAILWTNDKHTASIRCADHCSDAQLAINIAERKKSIAEWGTADWTDGALIQDKIALEPNNVTRFDGTCKIDVEGSVFRAIELEYPEPAKGKDPGWRQPYDVPRNEPRCYFNGDTVNAPNGWGVDEAIVRRVVRGKVLFNGVMRDYGSAA